MVWDGVHFVRLCQCGYEFDYQVAFLPLWPLLMKGLGAGALEPLLRAAGGVGSHGADQRAVACALSGLLLSNSFFIAAAVSLFRLARRMGLSSSLAMRACFLFAFNPATVFYSAIYTESLYTFLHFEALVHLLEERETLGGQCLSTFMLAAATFVRLNGVLSCAIVAAVRLRKVLVASLSGKGGVGGISRGALTQAKALVTAVAQCLLAC